MRGLYDWLQARGRMLRYPGDAETIRGQHQLFVARDALTRAGALLPPRYLGRIEEAQRQTMLVAFESELERRGIERHQRVADGAESVAAAE